MRSSDSDKMGIYLRVARGRAFDFKAHSTRRGLIEVPPTELERVGRARDLRFCPESGSRHSSVLDVCFQDNWLYVRALFDTLPSAVSNVYGGYVCWCEEGAALARSLPRETGDMACRKLAFLCLGYGRDIYALLSLGHYLCLVARVASLLSVAGSVSVRWHADACGAGGRRRALHMCAPSCTIDL